MDHTRGRAAKGVKHCVKKADRELLWASAMKRLVLILLAGMIIGAGGSVGAEQASAVARGALRLQQRWQSFPAAFAAGAGGLPTLSMRPKGWLADGGTGGGRSRRGWSSAGGVVIDPITQKVLLVRNRKERKQRKTNGWTFPKGKDEGDGPLETAYHEVAEESGVRAAAWLYLGALREESWRAKRPVTRHYYLMHKLSESGRFDRETSKIAWVSLDRATKLLQQKRDRKVLKQARRAITALERLGAPL